MGETSSFSLDSRNMLYTDYSRFKSTQVNKQFIAESRPMGFLFQIQHHINTEVQSITCSFQILLENRIKVADLGEGTASNSNLLEKIFVNRTRPQWSNDLGFQQCPSLFCSREFSGFLDLYKSHFGFFLYSVNTIFSNFIILLIINFQ